MNNNKKAGSIGSFIIKNKIYICSVIVLVVAILLTSFFNENEILKTLLSVPMLFSLMAVLYEVIKEKINYDREILIQNSANEFNTAISSHMANKTFDMHISFCEEYLNLVQNLTIELLGFGPQKNKW